MLGLQSPAYEACKELALVQSETEDATQLRFDAAAALRGPVYEMVNPWPVEEDNSYAYEHLAIGHFKRMSALERDSQVADAIDGEKFRMRLMQPEQAKLLKHQVFVPKRLGETLVSWALTKVVVVPGSRTRVRVPVHPNLQLIDVTEGRLPYLRKA